MLQKSSTPEYLLILKVSLLGILLVQAAHVTGQTPNSNYPDAPSSTSSNPQMNSPSTLSSGQNPFAGSVPQGKVSSEALPLSFLDAINRGLKNNLGVLLQSNATLTARGQRWKELGDLLPNLSAQVSENVAQDNLAARGLRFPGFPTVVGPYGFFDARVYLKQSVLDFAVLERVRAATANEQAAQYSYKDARDLVVLATGNAYLQALAGAARVETSTAQVETAQALYDKAEDQRRAGVIPAIDALRAKVELQNRQQQAIVARNDYAKQKLTLGRIIGLPGGQEITLTDQAPYEPLATLGLEEDLQRAFLSRSDYLAAAAQVRAAEHSHRAAKAEYLPSISMNANYGDLGITPGQSHGTFEAAANLNVPIFQGKNHADVLQAEAKLHNSQQQLENLRAQIEYDVRVALLDLSAAAEQVEVARSSVDLANQTVVQARDRFSAGVVDNLEVIQAQEALASANESYISSLYAHNLAKVELAHAIGFAEEGVKQYLRGK